MTTILPILLAAAIPLRNPFWPIGYEGQRETITAEPRVRTSASADTTDDRTTSVSEDTAPANDDSSQAADRLWIAARKSLKIGSTMKTGDGHQAVSINDKIYADGDLVSANHNGLRFTWRVTVLTDNGTLRLKRIKYKELNNE